MLGYVSSFCCLICFLSRFIETCIGCTTQSFGFTTVDENALDTSEDKCFTMCGCCLNIKGHFTHPFNNSIHHVLSYDTEMVSSLESWSMDWSINQLLFGDWFRLKTNWNLLRSCFEWGVIPNMMLSFACLQGRIEGSPYNQLQPTASTLPHLFSQRFLLLNNYIMAFIAHGGLMSWIIAPENTSSWPRLWCCGNMCFHGKRSSKAKLQIVEWNHCWGLTCLFFLFNSNTVL